MSLSPEAEPLLGAIREASRRAVGSGKPEAVLRDAVQPVLERLLRDRGVRSAVRDEARLLVPIASEAEDLDAPLASFGRADAIYNRFVIEFEPPGSLRASVLHSATDHAVRQVQQYLRGVADETGLELERLGGCAFDGSWIVYVTWERSAWVVSRPKAVDLDTLSALIDALESLATGRGLTAQNLDEDFGRLSDCARSVVQQLFVPFRDDAASRRAVAMFDQWQLDVNNSSGLFSAADLDDWEELCSSLGVPPDEDVATHVLFAIQTYFALVAKLVALVVLEGATRSDLVPLLTHGRSVWEGFDALESGALTRDTGAANAVEAGIFSWYVHERPPALEQELLRMATVASEYSAEIVEVTPLIARDVLKDLYQRLIPRPIRHRLGEYYTPDWLAERVVNQVTGSTSDLEATVRVLDPACGSGTFLVEVISRMLRTIPDGQEGAGLNSVLGNVVGFDLSPLAVQASKVNYLLAIAPLLRHAKAPVTIPVYLADSVAPPRRGGLLEGDAYVFETTEGDWRVPSQLAESHDLPALGTLLQQAIDENRDQDWVRSTLRERIPSEAASEPSIAGQVVELFEKLRALDRADRDGMWWHLLSNAFAPALQARFDYVVGNPPWVAWETLPAAYRAANDEQWVHYGLRPTAPPNRRQSSRNVQLDLSMLFTSKCVDSYLKESGRLGFVITASVFRSELAGRGFRERRLPPGSAFRFLHIDDLSALQVFDDAQNMTAVLVVDRKPPGAAAVPVTRWEPPGDGPRRIPQSVELEAVATRTVRRKLFAEPVDPTDPASPLLTMPRDGLIASRPLRRESPYLELVREGVNTRGANGVFFVEILEERDAMLVVRNLASEGRNRDVKPRKGVVESASVKTLLRGEDVGRGVADARAGLLFFHDEDHLSVPLPAAAARRRFPAAYEYTSHFERVLRRRRRFRSFDPSGDNWLGLYSVTPAAVARHKVVIREIATGMVAAPVQGADVIPDHKLHVIPVRTARAAERLASVLNSPTVDFMIRSFSVSTSISGSLLRYVSIQDLSRTASHEDPEADLAAALGLTVGEYRRIDSIARRELG